MAKGQKVQVSNEIWRFVQLEKGRGHLKWKFSFIGMEKQ